MAMVKVWPKNEQVRKVLYHPTGKRGFPAEGPVEWPDDVFTARIISDGDVLTEDPGAEKAAPEKKPAKKETTA